MNSNKRSKNRKKITKNEKVLLDVVCVGFRWQFLCVVLLRGIEDNGSWFYGVLRWLVGVDDSWVLDDW